ncbi:LegC family aminotransferase [Bacillus sp. 31A1R]|uniref:LegC family aminotransferase n=1 Tax=Robertmurraya mangrovi TaxID=3098077 RepID=A0ABU5IXT3_9BACI|nr:LegC family aminotransferase [Bacillus sp. 31A1R]MDZ5471962.1 LegC family aminotransferase [Bacillus sp. 31A1R]
MNTEWIEIARKIKNLYPSKGFLPLHEPTFVGNELKYISECLETGWVSSVGKYVDKFESMLAEYIGVKRVVAVVNGTAALHIALKVAGVQPNDEVIIPSLTFVATGNAVSYCGAVPHFVDISQKTLGIDPTKLDQYLREISTQKNKQCINKFSGKIIRAVVPMHTFGHPVDMDHLLEVCSKYNIIVVEDAAESLGSYYKGKHTGTFGKVSAMSFNGNKIITTGGGGAILTNDVHLAEYAKHLTTTAKINHAWKYEHNEVGYNYRMPNINAALGCAQIERINDYLVSKNNLVSLYKDILYKYKGIELFLEPPFAKSNYWLQTLIVDDRVYDIEKVLSILNNQGVMARPIWTPLHELVPFSGSPKSDLSETEKFKMKIINVPSSPYLGEK